ncbi:RDD family protein [Pseudoxanthomonas sangjuensis]|uniref:RDD family protein n=1 Tax=Pseudoxanthomonas sangjuensis TaxID=1503750 RepID=UPI0013912F3D|nr:RDD family protein [Pseudoxanthomonas sangjuensis]KAF1714133.1 transporter [Pseudoxanthomonas sangjuensis]
MSIWFYTDAEQQRLGPLSTDELKRFFRDGTITPDTLVWRDGMLQWRPLGELAAQLGLVETPPAAAGIHAAAPASPPQPPQPPMPPPPPAPEPPPPEPPPLTGRAMFSLGVEPSEAPPPRPAPAYASPDPDTQAEHNPYAPSQASLSPSSALYGRRSGDRDVVYAGFWKRAAAMIIDGVILSVVAGLGGEVLGTIFSDLSGGGEAALMVWVLLVTAAMYALYFAWFHSSFMMATPGKLAIGIKVVRSDGEPIGFLHALARYIATVLSTIPLMVGYLMAGFTGRKQALHDMICGTVVTDKWAFTDQPGMQRHELGTAAKVVLGLYALLLVLIFVAFFALGLAQAARGIH